MAAKTFECPVCGEDVPIKAKSCPHCGACEKSGWGDTSADGLDLPGDDDFGYDKFAEEELGIKNKSARKRPKVKIIGVALLILGIIGYVLSFTFF